MKRTALYGTHMKYGAKMVPFAGWEMPLSYSGVLDEHRSVRNAVGLFDVGHMGRFELSGKNADAFLSKTTSGPTHQLRGGEAQYSMLLNPEGGILDDIYIYKKETDRYLLIVNASNREKDFRWLSSQLPPDGSTQLEDITEETALLALQGPKSWEVLRQILPPGKKEISLRTFIETESLPELGAIFLIGRTGYTGEKGYELVIPNAQAEASWQALMAAGASSGIKPIGLGARDTLRLEMGYPLYGQEMDEGTTPLEADLGRFLDLEKNFIGQESLKKQQKVGLRKKLIAFELLVRGVPREGCGIFFNQNKIGKVTSGNYTPTLRKGIGMGYVDVEHSSLGTELLIDIRGKSAAALIVQKPFYRKKR